MSDDLAKFLFLGAMILIVFTSSKGAIYRYANSADRIAVPQTMAQKNEPPIFILEPEKKETVFDSGDNVPKKEDPNKTKTLALSASISEVTAVGPTDKTKIDGSGILNQTGLYLFGNENPPVLSAKRIVLADLASGETFFGFNEEKRWPIASITKLVSAAVVSKNIPMHDTITLSSSDFPLGLVSNGFREGQSYSVSDLFWSMLMKSSNEAAEALARHFGREKFIEAMNAVKNQWGLTETNFDDPTGLSASNQSTALDLVAMAKNIYERYPEIFEVTKRQSYAVTEINSGNKAIIRNINLFAGKDYFLGGKTGFTDEAGGNLLSIFSYRGRSIVVVILGSNDRFMETEKMFNWFTRNYR